MADGREVERGAVAGAECPSDGGAVGRDGHAAGHADAGCVSLLLCLRLRVVAGDWVFGAGCSGCLGQEAGGKHGQGEKGAAAGTACNRGHAPQRTTLERGGRPPEPWVEGFDHRECALISYGCASLGMFTHLMAFPVAKDGNGRPVHETQRREGVITPVSAKTRRQGAFAAALIVIAALVAWPFSGTTLGDDFSYVKTALDFANTGHLHYNGWASMMLGWQAVWGALFIKVFGFSFNVLRLSMLLLAGWCIYLFHQMLVRFGVRERDALLGALTLGLTPLFMPLAASFMSDVPGLLSVLLCAAMCQRTIVAKTDRATARWLVAAALTNLATGTVRQICWLGLLVMVPSTAWFLRRRHGVLMAGLLSWAVGAAGVFGCLQWMKRQPWTFNEVLWSGWPAGYELQHLGVQWAKALLYLALITLPVGTAWVIAAKRLTRHAGVLVLGAFGVMAFVWLAMFKAGLVTRWLMPWLWPVLASQGLQEPNGPLLSVVVLSRWVRGVLSVVAAGVGLIVFGEIVSIWRRRKGPLSGQASACFWIWGPFTTSLVLLLCPRAIGFFLQDRYLLLLLPAVILGMLRVFERATGTMLPALCFLVLVPFSWFAVGGLHDEQAGARADLRAVAQLESAGVPRTAISEGLGPDEWIEVTRTGHINSGVFQHSALGTYDSHVPSWNLPPGCDAFNREFVPSIHAEYFLTPVPGKCFVPSGFAPVPYVAWLPPFHRATYTERSAMSPGNSRPSGKAVEAQVH